jgi:hypothetical protein
MPVGALLAWAVSAQLGFVWAVYLAGFLAFVSGIFATGFVATEHIDRSVHESEGCLP